jgi:hypothetical protein
VKPGAVDAAVEDLALKPESDPSRPLEAQTEMNGKQPDPDRRHHHDRDDRL